MPHAPVGYPHPTADAGLPKPAQRCRVGITNVATIRVALPRDRGLDPSASVEQEPDPTSRSRCKTVDLSEDLAQRAGRLDEILVVDVDENSTLGLMAGDVVLSVGAREVDTVGRVLRLIRSYDDDEPIRFRIIRRGSETEAEGTID